MFISHRCVAAALGLIAACALTTTAFAHNGMRDTGSTLRQIGRGGAFIATEPDADSLSGNPAGLAFLCEPEAFFDVRMLTSHVEYEGLLNAQSDDKLFFAPNLAYAAPFGDKLAWGMGVFSISHTGYALKDFDLSRMGLPAGTQDSSSSGVSYLAVTPGLAVKLGPQTAAGASLNWSSGETEDQSYNIMGSTVGHRLDGLGGKGYALRLGLLHYMDEDTTIGAYWRSRSHLKVSGGTMHTGPLYTVPSAVIEDVEVTGGDFPEEYGLGLGRDVSDEMSVYAEWRRLKWAKVREAISINLPQGDPIVFPMHWSDQDVYVLGAEYRPGGGGQKLWRAGVNYGKSPVPEETIGAIFPATNELHLSAGYEKQLNHHWRLVTGLSYAFEHQQTSTAGNPNNALYGAGQPFTVGSSNWQIGIGLHWAVGKRHQAAEEDVACDCAACMAGEEEGE